MLVAMGMCLGLGSWFKHTENKDAQEVQFERIEAARTVFEVQTGVN